jgi:hypothetical protein
MTGGPPRLRAARLIALPRRNRLVRVRCRASVSSVRRRLEQSLSRRSLPVALALLAASLLPGAAEAAVVSVTPGVARAGAPVTVSVRGLPPRTSGVARLSGARSRSLRSDSRGRASVVMHLRRSAGGSRRLSVRAGRTSVSTRVTVGSRRSPSSNLTASSGGQRVLLEPTSGRAGERFGLKVSGFARGSLLTVRLSNSRITQRRAARGSTRLAGAVPALSPARRRLVVRSGRTILALTFQVLPPVAPPPPVLPPPPPPMALTSPVLVGAGDIAGCNNPGDEATAALLDGIPGTVFTLGDNVYPSGTLAYFNACYEPSWGRHKARTRPVAGNHDYDPGNASGYFDYFGASAGERGRGYYSYDLGTWHVVVLDSDCTFVGGCGAGSAQEQWLRADLAAHPANCTVAMMHHPRFSSGAHGNATAMAPFWQALYEAGADLVLAGHDHDYERFAPMNPGGAADPAFGIRSFIVGTGGFSHSQFGATFQPNSERHDDTSYGVLKLTLHNGTYDWQFVPEAGKTFTDAGTGTCHAAPTG